MARAKKGSLIVQYFKDKEFSGAPAQSIDNTIPEFEVCAMQQLIKEGQKFLLFGNALSDPAKQFFLIDCSPLTPSDQIVPRMHRLLNSETRKLQLQSETYCLYLPSFMQKHHITDASEGLSKHVD